MEAPSACELFHRCVHRRDGEEWREFLRRYQPRLRAAVRRAFLQRGLRLAEPDLEDLVQDLYCRLLAAGGKRFRGRTERELWGYLGQVAKNVVIDHQQAARARKRWPGIAAAGIGPPAGERLDPVEHEALEAVACREASPEERLLVADYRRFVLARCRQVTRGERAVKVLRLAFLEDWSSPEIARRLGGGLTANKVDMLVYRLKRRLAKEGIRLPRRRGGFKTPTPEARRPRRRDPC